MFNISKLVNRITDRGQGQGNGRDGTGESSASFMESEEQHSAEGFLCPPCMRAFPSAEALEEHYNATHVNNEENPSPSDSQSSTNGDIQILRQEIQNLQSSLNEEKSTSAELKNEVLKMQAGFQSRDEDGVSVRSQEKEFENTKSLLTSEVSLLRQQLTDSLELVSQIKKEKEILGQTLLALSTENDSMKSDVTSLKSQLAHRNSVDDAAVLKQELVSVQRMMDQLSLEKEKQIEELHAKIKDLEISLNLPKAEEEKHKMSEAKSQILLLEKQIKVDKETAEVMKNKFLAIQEKASKDLDTWKEKLSDSDRKRELAEKEAADLKELVKRQQDQQAELYNKIEGGEGAKAALETLQKENEIFKQSLESAQESINEGLKKIYNINKKLEKTEVEHRKLGETYTTEIEEWKAKELLWKDQIQRQDDDIKLAADRQNELSKDIQGKDCEIKSLQSLIEKSKQEVGELNKQLSNLMESKEEQRGLMDKLELEVKNLRDIAIQRENKLKEVQNSNEKLLIEIERKTEELKTISNVLQETSSRLQDSQDINKNIEEKLLNTEKEKAEIHKTYAAQVKIIEGELNEKTEALKNKTEELEKAKKSSIDAVEKFKAELKQSQQDLREKAHQLEGLHEEIQDARSKFEEKEGKIQLLQVQTDEILTDKIDLERRVKSNEEEKSLLLERCLSGESEVEELRETIKTIQRKLDDSHAALQELGRENQSLQMESAKLQGRKWADDSVVTNCSTCEKEFTLTIRKHHCRHCGQIFCNDCSSRNAAVPSCKKPARVCDACYQELMSK